MFEKVGIKIFLNKFKKQLSENGFGADSVEWQMDFVKDNLKTVCKKENGERIFKDEILSETNFANIAENKAKERLKFDTLDFCIIKVNLHSFDFLIELYYTEGGEPKKQTFTEI